MYSAYSLGLLMPVHIGGLEPIGVARTWRLGGKEVEWRFRSWDTYQNVRVGVIASAEGAKL